MELLFVLLFAYLRRLKNGKVKRAADIAATKVKAVIPVTIK
jgi:hypothetical protein